MTTVVAGLPLVERIEAHGRVRLALVDHSTGFSRDVCGLTIDPLQLHDGTGGLVSVGGVGNVATIESHRRQGLATQLLELAIDRMRGDGLDGSLLYGIDRFYEPFGWSSCGDERWVEFDAGGAVELDDAVTIRPMRDADRPGVIAAYDRIAARTRGAIVRSAPTWDRLELDEVVVVARDGELAGWAWRGGGMGARGIAQEGAPGCAAFIELQAVDVAAAAHVLHAARAMVAATGEPTFSRIATGAPDGHPIRELGRSLGARLVDERRPYGGAMLLPFTDAATCISTDTYQFVPDRF